MAVDVQSSQEDSLLNFYRRLLRWRNAQPALIEGEMDLLASHPQVLAYVRSGDGQKLLCLFNFSDQPAQWTLPANLTVLQVLTESGLAGSQLEAGKASMPAWSGLFALLK